MASADGDARVPHIASQAPPLFIAFCQQCEAVTDTAERTGSAELQLVPGAELQPAGMSHSELRRGR